MYKKVMCGLAGLALLQGVGIGILKHECDGLHEQILQTECKQIESAKMIHKLEEEKEFLQKKTLQATELVGTLQKDRRVGVNQNQLRGVIQSTLSFLGEPNLAAWTNLMLVTVAAESDMGFYLVQHRGPAISIFQYERPTAREALDWCKRCRPELYSKIKSLCIPAKLSASEGSYNIAYATAVCYVIYKWRNVNPIGKDKQELASIHKIKWNTVKGKGSVDRTLKKLVTFNVNIK